MSVLEHYIKKSIFIGVILGGSNPSRTIDFFFIKEFSKLSKKSTDQQYTRNSLWDCEAGTISLQGHQSIEHYNIQSLVKQEKYFSVNNVGSMIVQSIPMLRKSKDEIGTIYRKKFKVVPSWYFG